jgi:hypothetical protein
VSTTKPQISAVPSELPTDDKPKRRLRMADAMRIEGVDETAVAKTYRSLLGRKTSADTTQDAKLLLETARDCAEILEPPSESDEIPANAIVQLIHSVPRPDRDVTGRIVPPEAASG